MKLPNDIKQAITKELLEELSQDDYEQAKDLIHHCFTCSADITAQEMFCSAVCLEEDLVRRKNLSKIARNIKTPHY